jgi:hypothetical protein
MRDKFRGLRPIKRKPGQKKRTKAGLPKKICVRLRLKGNILINPLPKELLTDIKQIMAGPKHYVGWSKSLEERIEEALNDKS